LLQIIGGLQIVVVMIIKVRNIQMHSILDVNTKSLLCIY